MIVFESERLTVGTLEPIDLAQFRELLTDPEIVCLIPQPPYQEDEIRAIFEPNVSVTIVDFSKPSLIWGIYEKGKTELIGICGLLTNDENDRELAYRFRVKYWRKGFATEVTKRFIEFCFHKLEMEKLTADVYVKNIGSVKILEKFMSPVKEFFNEKDNCTDRRYAVNRATLFE